MRYVEVTTPAGLVALRAIMAHLRAHFGLPIYGGFAGGKRDGRPDPDLRRATRQMTRALPHPTVAGRHALLIEPAVRPVVQALIAACVAKVAGGTATAAEAAIAALPADVAALDPTWNADPSGTNPPDPLPADVT